MKKLQCTVCGGKLIMNEDEIAVCENCGMEYKPAALQRMIVELSGPIEVQGIDSRERLVERARAFEAIEKYDDACSVYKELADRYPEEPMWLYKICCIDIQHIEERRLFESLFENENLLVLSRLDETLADRVRQLQKTKLENIVNFNEEFDNEDSTLVGLIVATKYQLCKNTDSRFMYWIEQADDVNKKFREIISFDPRPNGGDCELEWANENRAVLSCLVVKKNNSVQPRSHRHYYHIILDTKFESDLPGFLDQVASHDYVSSNSTIPSFSWRDWRKRKAEEEREADIRMKELTEKYEESRRRRERKCLYCGGDFKVKTGFFKSKTVCSKCGREKNY